MGTTTKPLIAQLTDSGLQASTNTNDSIPIPVENKEKLPLEWTHVGQIHHASKEEQEHSIAIHDLFAKSELKRQHPRSVYKFKEDHSEELEIEHSIFCPSEGKPLEPSFEDIKTPEGASLKIESEGVILTYTTRKRLNSYLLHKGFQNMARLKANPSHINFQKKETL